MPGSMRKALRFDGNCEAFVIAVALRAVSLQASPWPWLQSVNAPSRCSIWCARKSVMRPSFKMPFSAMAESHIRLPRACTATTLQQSMTEPPPTARMSVTPCSRASAAPSWASSAYAVVPSPKWTRGGVRVIERNHMHLLVLSRGCAGRLRRLGAEGPQSRFAVRRSLTCGLSIATGSNNRSSVSARKFTSITFPLLPTSANRTPTL